MSNINDSNIDNSLFFGSDKTTNSQTLLGLSDQLYFGLNQLSPAQQYNQNNSNNYEQSLLTNSSFNNLISNVNEELSNTLFQNNLNSLRRRSTGCFTTSKVVVPMQPLQESTSISSLNSMQNRFQQQQQQQQLQQHVSPEQLSMNQWIQHQQQQQQQQQQLQRNVRSSSFSVPYNPIRNESSPVNVPKNRLRRLSTSSVGSFSAGSSISSSVTGSPSNIWEKVLHQNYLNNTSIRNNTRNLLSMMNSSASSSLIKGDSDEQNKNLEEKIAISGNMFYKRDDWEILNRISSNKQNTMHIRLEDEGPYGNDEIRCYVLSHFSSLCIRDLKCVLCNQDLKIYDRFPLVDGTLFLSPFVYDKVKAINAGIANREQYIYGVCLKCLNGENNVKCKFCKQEWKSESIQIGTLYKFDIFAAFPCCQKRLNCNKCNKPVIDLHTNDTITASHNTSGINTGGNVGGLPYFSSYSEEYECPHCKLRACHFIKPLDIIYSKSG